MTGKRKGPMSAKQAAHLTRLSQEKVRHDKCAHPLYCVYYGMRGRCLNPSNASFKNYGGRGVAICADWESSFTAFFSWAMANGWKRGLHLDRIDTNGNYEPGNCRFISQAENNRNRRNTRMTAETISAVYSASGSHADVSRKFGIPYTIVAKIRRGQTYTNITQGESA
jgi:hypothetical protein